MRALYDRTTSIDVGIVDIVVLRPSVKESKGKASASSRSRSSAPWDVLTMRRAAGVRCTGAWELVHGSIETGERPADAALREVREESGLTVERLYSVTVNPFYLHRTDSIQLALVFAAIVAPDAEVVLSPEHDALKWRSPAAAIKSLTWPREHQAVRYVTHLLRSGDAGAAEDVLLVR
jgi:dATP pyrophosphohydrolase